MSVGERICLKAILKEKQLWLLFLLGLLYCYRPLFVGETYFYRDLYEHSIPQKRLFVDLVRAGEMPLWDPYLHGGQPYLAEINNLPLYPSALLYLILPFFTAFNVDIALHIIFCGWAAYGLCRVLGFSRTSALAAGLVYEFCGFTVSQVNLLNRLTALPYLPLVLMFWHLYVLERKKRFFICSALAATIQLFAASPETSLLTYLTLLLWTLCFPYPAVTTLRKIKGWLALMIFVAGISAIQIIPTVEMILQSSRPHHDFETFTSWSLHPKRFPEFVLPRFFGRTDALAESEYWGKAVEGVPYAYVMSIYFGFLTLGLMFTGAFTTDPRLPSRVRKYLFLQILLATILCMGKFVPGYRFIFEYVPFIHWFRYPIKFMAAAIFPMAVLTAFAVEVYFANEVARISRKYMLVLWIATALLVTLTVSFFLSERFSNAIMTFFFNSNRENIQSGLRASFVHATAIGLLCALLFLARSHHAARWQETTVVLILLLDLFIVAKPVNPSAPRKFFTATPNLVTSVKEKIGDGRLFRDEVPSRVVLRAPSNDVVWQNLWYMQVLNYYVGAYYRIPVIFHRDYDDLAQLRIVQLKNWMDQLPWKQRIPILSAASVRLVLTEQRFTELPLAATVRNPSNLTFYLYENPSAAPRVVFASRALFAKTSSETLKMMAGSGFDSRTSVVLEENATAAVQNPCDAATINTVESKVNHAKWSVRNDCNGFLVISQPYYPGWRVTVDGKQARVLRANYAFSAVYLPAGSHEVRRYFLPASVLIGAAASFSFLLLLILLPVKMFE